MGDGRVTFMRERYDVGMVSWVFDYFGGVVDYCRDAWGSVRRWWWKDDHGFQVVLGLGVFMIALLGGVVGGLLAVSIGS